MTFAELLHQILRDQTEGMTPQQIRETIKLKYPSFYGTESHQRNVAKGHYNDLDHALLAQIYVASRNIEIAVDKTQKPMRLSLVSASTGENPIEDEDIDSENLERLEAGVGTLYVLGTNLFTNDGLEIVKIGITTGNVESRVTQLFTTGVPFRFRIIAQLETRNYAGDFFDPPYFRIAQMGRGTAPPLGGVVEGYRVIEEAPPSVGKKVADCHLPICAKSENREELLVTAAPAPLRSAPAARR